MFYDFSQLQKEFDAEYMDEVEAWVRRGMKPQPKTLDKHRDKSFACIRTFTGKVFYPFNPSPRDVDLRDIAHALAGMPRYGNHTLITWSVCQHAMLAADIAIELAKADEYRSHAERQLHSLMKTYETLHHDDPEAYILDMMKPIKMFLPDYLKLEEGVTTAVNKALGIIGIHKDFVKQCDVEAYNAESRILFDRRALDNTLKSDVPFSRLLRLTPTEAEKMFLDYTDWLNSELQDLAKPDPF